MDFVSIGTAAKAETGQSAMQELVLIHPFSTRDEGSARRDVLVETGRDGLEVEAAADFYAAIEISLPKHPRTVVDLFFMDIIESGS